MGIIVGCKGHAGRRECERCGGTCAGCGCLLSNGPSMPVGCQCKDAPHHPGVITGIVRSIYWTQGPQLDQKLT